MRIFTFLLLTIVINSCVSEGKIEQEIPEKSRVERPELSLDSKIFLGNRLFSEKTCIKCHSVDRVKVGPSVADIMHHYKKNNASIVTFLKGESEPIVDTNDSLVAIMQANIDGFLKNITDEELDAIATYMMHIDELNKK